MRSISLLTHWIYVPLVIKCSQTNIEEDRVTALCILLRRLACPIHLVDVEMQLGWERSQFSRITHLVTLILFDRWKHLLCLDPICLNPVKIAEFGTAVAAKGAPLDVVVALIDGTLQKMHVHPITNGLSTMGGSISIA